MGKRFFFFLALLLCCSVSVAEEKHQKSVPIKCVGHEGPVDAVAVSPDGKRTASVSGADNTLRMWNTANGEELYKRTVCDVPGKGRRAKDVLFTPDGSLVVVASSGVPRFWEVNSGKEVDMKCMFTNALSMANSPDGKLLALVQGYSVEIWKISSCEQKQSFPPLKNPDRIGPVAAASFSPDGNLLAVSFWGKDGGLVPEASPRVHVWNIGSGEEEFAVWNTVAHVWGIAFSPDGKFLAAVDELGQLRMWNFQTHDILFTNNIGTGPGYSVAFSPNGKTLATSCHDPSIKLWDTTTGEVAGDLKGHTAYVKDLSFSPDAKFLVSGSGDHLVMIWPINE